MIPLYTDEEFQSSKYPDLLPLQCKHCGKTFFQKKRYIVQVKYSSCTVTGEYCSYSCSNRARSTGNVKLKCSQCQKIFERPASYQKSILKKIKSDRSFCSRSCSATYTNTHKTHGTTVSKLEKYIAAKIIKKYPNLEFHFNRKDAINSELDIFIPSLKLAFELNGIFHYEPIFGLEKLKRTQTNDQRKAQACYERNIEFCTIDTSGITYFKEQKADKYLDIICSIINSKLPHS